MINPRNFFLINIRDERLWRTISESIQFQPGFFKRYSFVFRIPVEKHIPGYLTCNLNKIFFLSAEKHRPGLFDQKCYN